MKKSEIKVGGHYIAKVSDKLVTVRVDEIVQPVAASAIGYHGTRYYVTNLATGRKTTFRSAMKFRSHATPVQKAQSIVDSKGLEKNLGELADEAHRNKITPEEHDHQHALIIGREAMKRDCPERKLGSNHAHEYLDGFCRFCGRNSDGVKWTLEDEQGSDPTEQPSSTNSQTSSEPMDSVTPQAQNQGFSETPGISVKGSAPEVSTSPTPSGLAAKLASKQVPTDDAPHVIVRARAGTGKTTTLVEGLRYVLGGASKMVPSPQQKAVWESMALSAGKAKSVCFVAFNKSIATELQARVPKGCEAMTMHSLGFKAVNKAFNRLKVEQYRVDNIIESILGRNCRDIRREEPILLNATKQLVGLCKMNLAKGTEEELSKLAAHYDIDLNGSRNKVFDLVPKVLERCLDPQRDGCVDFDDMVWLPIALNLPLYRYDLLLVDEAQDLNRCQQALAKRSGKRIILCGDEKQAIYGFAGADSESMARLETELSNRCSETDTVIAGARGCIVLPLTVTRRCGHAIVAEAQKIVPDFEAFETNNPGKIGQAVYPTHEGKERPTPHYTSQVEDGDMVLCRVNAPLVSQCFRFLKSGRKANIQGRDVGAGLVRTVEKVCHNYVEEPVASLISKLDDWLNEETTRENSKRNPSEARLIALQDRYDCLAAFCDGAKTAADVIAKINSIFTDSKDKTGIRLSSIHRAKGLEAKRVFFLMPKGGECPHPMARTAWQQGQEMNLKYVAITRAIEELVYVY